MNLKKAVETEDVELLDRILNEGKDNIESRWAASNPNCPPEVLAKVLKMGKDNGVSYWITQNPNCPPKALLKWYEATGKLTKYNPAKHELEHDNEDNDLEELKKLL